MTDVNIRNYKNICKVKLLTQQKSKYIKNLNKRIVIENQ